MIHAWRIVVLTTRMAVPVSESIAFSVGITMVKVYVFAAGRFEPTAVAANAVAAVYPRSPRLSNDT